MKTCFVFLAALMALGSSFAAETGTALTSQKQKVSYSIGINLGRSWKNQDIDVDLDCLTRGIKDIMAGQTLALTDEEMKTVIQEYQKEMRAKFEQRRKEQGEKNLKEGTAFLEENKKKDGVVTLPSGLQYKVLAAGQGESPKATDRVKVNYKGTLIDGTEFDSSYKRGQPAVFGVSNVVKGWTEALQLMKVGAKWQLFIPANLAYGEMGNQRIAPNAVLLFDIELLGIEPPAAPPAPVTSDIIKVPSKEEMEKGAKIEVIKKEDVEKEKK